MIYKFNKINKKKTFKIVFAKHTDFARSTVDWLMLK